MLSAAVTLSSLLSGYTASAAAETDAKGMSVGIADPATIAMMNTQKALDKVADRIEAANPELTESGLSGFYVDAQNNTLRVYWKGALPDQATKAIEEAKAQGMTVHLNQAPYTRGQLRAEVARLTKLNMSGTTKEGPRLVSVGPKWDGSGITMKVTGLAKDSGRAQALAAIPGLASQIATDIAEEAPTEAVDRFFDSQPFYGGAYVERRIDNSVQNGCSSAFAAQAGGLTFMMSAAHCGNGAFWTGGEGNPRRSGNYIGTTAAGGVDRSRDVQLIVANSAPLMFDGGSVLHERPQFTKTVSGSAETRPGHHLCVSGSYSGAHCNIFAEEVGLSIEVGGFGTVIDVVHAAKRPRAGTGVVGNGDSGGPVFSLDGDTKVVARGVISAMPSSPSDQDACAGVPGDPPGQPGRHCSWRFYFPDITAMQRSLGFTVRTGV